MAERFATALCSICGEPFVLSDSKQFHHVRITVYELESHGHVANDGKQKDYVLCGGCGAEFDEIMTPVVPAGLQPLTDGGTSAE